MGVLVLLRLFVSTSTHNLCFVQKYEKHLSFLSENFQILEMKFSIYLNRHVFVMIKKIALGNKGHTTN